MPRPEGRGLWLSVFDFGQHFVNQLCVDDLFVAFIECGSYHTSYPSNTGKSGNISFIVFGDIAVF
jgi:hypothetical protein